MSGPLREPFGDPDDHAEATWVSTPDGVRLATDVWLPGAPGRLPTVLIRVPYDKLGPFAMIPWIARELLTHGYAVVTQDVRGKIRSDGETFAFVHEVADGAATLDWIVSQPWSNGDVGMLGDSYYGFTQWAAAASGHPALRCIVPRMTSTEIGTTWMYSQGVFNLFTMLDWASLTWVDEHLWSGGVDWSIRPLIDILPASHGGRQSRSFDAWIDRGPDDPWWTDAVFAGRGNPRDRADLPTLAAGGWWDVFVGGQVRDFLARQDRFANQHLEMGSRDHWDLEHRAAGEPPPDVHDPAVLASWIPHYVAPAVRFFARYLRGDRGAGVPAVRWHLSNDGWHEDVRWPPSGSVALDLHLAQGGEGALSEHPSTGAEVRWTHDPADPVPSRVEDAWAALAELPDEDENARRPDVVTFTGDEMTTPLDLTGPQAVTLRLRSTGPSTHAIAQLVDVAPDGPARRFAEGATLVTGGRDEREVTVDLGHCAYRLAPGHRLRLQLASSCYPRYLLHPGTDADPWTTTRYERTDQTLRSDGSVLRLTVRR
jgi:putative CocE/NonD family hydrolase